MNWTATFLEVIDLRSFSSVWYWIVVAAAWSQASYFVMGVPFDVIQRARREGGQAHEDLRMMAHVQSGRITRIVRESGLWLAGFAMFFHSSLLVLALWYDIELALALELLLLPMTGIGILSLRTALRFEAGVPDGPTLAAILMRQRFWTQLAGMAAIFIAATVGMYDLLYVPRF